MNHELSEMLGITGSVSFKEGLARLVAPGNPQESELC